jgi:hypothetical protein
MKELALDETAGKLLVLGLGAVLVLVGLAGSLWPTPPEVVRAHRAGERPREGSPAPSLAPAPEPRPVADPDPRPAPVARNDRLARVTTYLESVNAGRYRVAYDMLATPMPYDAFVASVDASNRAFAESLKQTDAELVSKKIEKVEPVTAEADYLIVAVTTRVSARRAGELYVQDMSSQIYCRFDARGKIALLYNVGA